ncbi:hypothetical protein TNCV_1447421 [Trichonephila clavipes]|nr:hypothetical protein TNCV_1447421 [Trichonephila clavipes]
MEQLSCWKRNGPSLKYCHIVGSAALSRMFTFISEFMFPNTGTNGPRPNHKKRPLYPHYAFTTKLNSRHNVVHWASAKPRRVHPIARLKSEIRHFKEQFSTFKHSNDGELYIIAIDDSHSVE